MAPTTLINLVSLECDPKEAHDFNPNKCAPVAAITGMDFTIKGKSLEADTPIKDPENPDSTIKAVAVLDRIVWSGGPTDPVEIEGRLSPKNRGILLECVASQTGGSDIAMSWVTKCYDHSAKKFFDKFHTDGKKIKFVLTEGQQVDVNEQPDPFIKQPVNYRFKMSLTAKSDGEDQTVCYAASASQKLSKPIGVNVG